MRFAASVLGITALMSTSALAADLVLYDPVDTVPEVAYDPSYDWTGFYAGVSGGLVVGDSALEQEALVPTPATYAKTYDPSGGFLGVHAGYLFALDNGIVFGLEGDWQWMEAEGELALDGPGPVGVSFTGTSTLNSMGSIRGRLGYAADRTLFYVTGGFAVADYDYSYGPNIVGVSNTAGNFDAKGYTAGVGVAQAFTDTIIGHVEYRYSDFGTLDIDGDPMNPADPAGTLDLKTHDIRAGISLKF
jgi:outer membrane immunogenic protein